MTAVEAPPRRRVVADRVTYLVLAVLAYGPLLRTKPNVIGADTKHYLYLDPDQLMDRAASIWDPSIGLGTVSHQNVGYLWPMGPWYSLFEGLGAPDWVAQRLWLATLLFAAGTGVMFLLRQLGMRGLGASVAALSYMLSPYILAYAARISAILLPWAGLPWLLGIFILALRRGGWRWPAAFALVVTTIGSINASSLLFAALAVVTWIPFAIWHTQEIDGPTAGRTVGRVAVLTAITQVWWLVALLLSNLYGPPVLETTETFEAVSTSSLSTEVARSLGNWFFYGRDALGPWVEASVPYTQEGWLMVVSFTLPVLAIGSVAVVRWQHRAYFTSLIVVGAVIAIAAFPFDDPSPYGSLAQSLTDSSTLALALRNAQRAVPLVALGTAVLLGTLVNAIGDRLAWGRVLATAPIALLVLANFPSLWDSTLVDDNLQRPEDLPTYLVEAAAELDESDDGTRVLELPGTDFGSYRFGNTVDPILPGLIDRPWVGRESAPQGTEGAIDLVGALDRRLQQGTFEPQSLAPLARLMNASDIVVRGDLQTERYRTPRPHVLADWFDPVPPGLRPADRFGVGTPNEPIADLPLVDELELGRDLDAVPFPAISIHPVTGVDPIISTQAGTNQIVLSGDGDGIVDAAAAGLLEGDELVVYSGDLPALPDLLDGIVFDADARVILTDTNRRRAERFTTLRENTGYTELADERPLATDPSDARIDLFPDAGDDGDPTRTVTVLEGAEAIRATSYGNIVTYIPEERPIAAFDRDPDTAWRTSAFGSPVGERIRVDFGEARTIDELTLLQPVSGDRNRFITEVAIHVSGFDEPLVARLDDSSRTGPGQTLQLGPVRTEFVEIEITADSAGRRGDYGGLSAVGFAEVTIPGLDIETTVRLPTDVVARAGGHGGPLSVVLTRLRANPAEPVRDDPEVTIDRVFTMPETPAFFEGYEVAGTVRLSDRAPDDLIDRLLGIRGADAAGVTATSSSRLPGSPGSRASSALDGDPDTAWVPGFGDPVGQFVRFEFGRVVTADHLDLQVLADRRHSVPTRLSLSNELGEAVEVDVPAVTSLAVPGSTQTVRVELPEAFSFQVLRVTIAGVEAVTTTDYFSRTAITLPVGVVELGFSGGETVPDPEPTLDDGCRADLVSLDGEPVPIRIAGELDSALARDGLDFEGCDDVVIVEGEHRVEVTAGATTGLDVDRVVFDRILPGTPDPVDLIDRGPSVRSDRTSRSSVDVVLRDADEPFFVVFGESYSDAWNASIEDGTDPPEPIRVNGYANAWFVDPSTADPDGDGTIEMTLRWTPQTWATRAQQLSLAGVIVCVFLLVTGRRTREHDDDAPPPPALADRPLLEFAWDHPGRPLELVPTVSVSLVTGVASALFVDPAIGPLVACAAIVAGLRPPVRAILPVAAAGAVAVAGALTVGVQMWKQYPPGFNWAANYDVLHPLGLTAFALLALSTAIEVVAARSAPPRQAREEPNP